MPRPDLLMRLVRPLKWAMTGALIAAAGAARAQTADGTVLINTALPPSFDRDRNVSVLERSRPDYQALGITAGGFDIFPTLRVGGGYSNNILLSGFDKREDGFAVVAPSVVAQSDWALHEVRASAAAELSRYFSTPRRNQENWNVSLFGRLDAAPDTRITAEGQVARTFESPLTGDIQSEFTVLSSYIRTYLNLRAEQSFGRARATLAVDRSSFDFNDLNLGNAVRSQRERDRNLLRGTGQLEYALSPSAAVYTQVNYVRTNYDTRLLSGQDNRDSNAWRGLAGMTLDLAGLARGRFGAGYTHIDYRSPIYRPAKGFSAEAQIEYFYSELTTFTLRAARTFQDANIGFLSGFVDNRVTLRVDHELLRNLLLNVSAEVAGQDYVRSPLRNKTYRITGGARYLISPLLELVSNAAYLDRTANRVGLGQDFNEFRATVGVVLHR